VAAGNACDRKLLTTADVSGLLSATVDSVYTIPGDPESCKFSTAAFAWVEVTLRPGQGRVTVQTWNSGKMPLTAAPFSGVGNEAAWVNDLHEVVAEKNNVLCDIQLTGPAPALAQSPVAEQQQKIGALCNKIFAGTAP
jgi:hypothetical protein